MDRSDGSFGWIVGWMDRSDGWFGWMDGSFGWMDGWFVRMDGWFGWMGMVRLDGWFGWMDGMDGWWMDGMDGLDGWSGGDGGADVEVEGSLEGGGRPQHHEIAVLRTTSWMPIGSPWLSVPAHTVAAGERVMLKGR